MAITSHKELPAVHTLKGNFAPLLFSRERNSVEGSSKTPAEYAIRSPLAAAFRDKGYKSQVLADLAARGELGELLMELVFRDSDSSEKNRLDQVLSTPLDLTADSGYTYTGTQSQNALIDRSIKESSLNGDERRQFSGSGATKLFSLGNLEPKIRRELLGSPVVVLGAGAAGVFAARVLVEMGFRRELVTVIDRTGRYNGIWNQPNVSDGSKNNPFELEFRTQHDVFHLKKAPGRGSTVAEFLDEVVDEDGIYYHDTPLPKPIKGLVTAVKPGDLNHRVIYKEGNEEKELAAPIVINTLGVGRPLPPSDPNHMVTNATGSEAGIRWQQQISPEQAQKLDGKTLVFIGLGNSTAEMMTQVEELREGGININYRVLTHHPPFALHHPSRIVVDGKEIRIFRDIKEPNLTGFAGDLDKIHGAYLKAFGENRIVPDIVEWQVSNGRLTATARDGVQTVITYNQLYTLIGYGQDPDLMRQLGLNVTDEYLGSIAADYDGEIQRAPGAKGRDRLYPGYFGLGSILRNPQNKNAVVIPGIFHRLYDFLFTATLRSAEYKLLS